ncbi:exocyst complex component EXO84B-like [Herrania umbratica]|uniref:Exocyst complex component EXO84B-like n=1 Tax=Herrania umbratica TaxID=108875 RepID=A0A6J1A0Q0_9ROSI|nr:exocyst complex component EXO84B-like [Herrania umbratica]
MEDAPHSDTSSGMSSVSSDLDAETELQSMAGKGIKHLCSELLELKAESDEDFHRNIFSNYSSFVRIFNEVKGMENELMQLKSQLLTQKRLVKDLIDGIHLKLLSEETIDSILQESESAELTSPSELEVHIDNISETLDILMLENRADEAIAILEMEAENLQRMQYKDNSSADLLLLYNSAFSEKKAMLTLQLTLSAENPRISAAELRKVLVGICRLGDSHLSTQLLLKYYHSRIATGMHNLQCSQSFSDGLYVKELAKFVFSMISQAARSFMMLYGETSPHASELIQWAREETKLFVASFNTYVKSNSDISKGISMAVESMQFAMSYCSLLKSQRLFLRPYLIKHIRPCMEEVLQIHIDHFKKIISMFTATDTWVLGTYLISEILSEGNYMDFGQQPEYCHLTNSGRKFVTLLQAIIADVTPLLAIQIEGAILKGLMNLFTEYIDILEKAITFETHVSENGSRRTSAESLPQQISMLANLSTLQNFFFKVIRSFFRGTGNMNSELRKKKSIDFQQKELDGCILFIQEAAAQLRSHFCKQFINRMMSLETGSKLIKETCTDNQEELTTFHDAMPSIAFQVLFLELRKVDKLAEENVVEEDWSMELLRELIEAIFSWIVNNKEIWRYTKEDTPVQLSDIFSQFVLDMHFMVEIVKYGGYFSKIPLVLLSLVDSAFTSAGLDPKRDIDGDGWAKTAATEAIQKLLEIEKMQLFSKDDSVDILEESHENEPVQNESTRTMKDSLLLGQDPSTTDAVEIAITTETVMTAKSPCEGSLSPADVEDFSVDKSVVVLADNYGGVEDVESENGISQACNEHEKTDLPDPSSFDGYGDASELRVPNKKDSGNEADATDSVVNELEDDGKKVVGD